MIANLKALVVVLTIAIAVFALGKPIWHRFMTAQDFCRRRNTWLLLTVTAFVSPSFWLFVLVAGIAYIWAASKDTHILAFYLLMLHVIPPTGLEIPGIGSIRVFDLGNYRLLAMALLAPFAWKLFRAPDDSFSKFTWTDILVLAYAGLQLVLNIPYEAPTNTLRRALLLGMDFLLPYYAFSRGLRTQAAIIDVLACYCLACAISAPIAAFEAAKTWPLYGGIGELWNLNDEAAYVFRGNSLRALASAGHPLALGYVMSMGFGFWLYLRTRTASCYVTLTGAGVMWLGLLAAYSRAPWIVAIAALFAYLFLQPRGMAKLLKASLVFAALAGVVLVSPVGSKIIDNLPFVGTVDLNNVVYRQRLADLSWKLVAQNPLFGDPFVMSQMEEMRQGEGIIDLVNAYATVALFSGLVGLTLFCGIFITAGWNYFSTLRKTEQQHPDFSLLGSNLLACLLGTLIMMATGSFATSLALIAWMLAALGTAYAAQGRARLNAGLPRTPNSSLAHLA